ncbi:ThiJ/PfpI family protein [Histoplasma capsulatum G186AR]|uniref:D-lactate dehydratase n=2 Tax=Ajellomyces capsulatus TaxID=5037 RepID=C0NMT7_AJECG|nr:ThiJ/PfpI family protein [Histoplasma capsulatum G186AR]EEH07185.1 ThiJ/PfpI family protein [Histoplasma capsulatum G186AR]KAG5287888.1 ThiJ/PfpI family protein [Histoplasma capsulatum]QSS70296.1 ThiJ/PfpI family protein [Histoplasma capsulatum G186AR]
MAPKVLFVLTSQDKIPATGNPTGWYLPELAHPYEVLKGKVDLVIASPKGGPAPLDPASVTAFAGDAVSSAFLKENESIWHNTVKLSDVKSSDFDAIFYVGGHGPLFDLYEDADSLRLIKEFAEARKVVSAVCHGPAVFLKATAGGKPVLAEAQATGFSNEEEDQVKMSQYLPYALETEMNKISNGGYVKADLPWGEKVVVAKVAATGAPLITGQNPASATAVGTEILKALGL